LKIRRYMYPVKSNCQDRKVANSIRKIKLLAIRFYY
jgi:hypothetical protein